MSTNIYTVDMGPTARFMGKGASDLPNILYLELLSKCCTVDGLRSEQVEFFGYERQPIQLTPFNAKAKNGVIANHGDIVFAVPDDLEPPIPSHAAIVDEEGLVVAYGFLVRSRDHAGPNGIHLPASAVRVRFSRKG